MKLSTEKIVEEFKKLKRDVGILSKFVLSLDLTKEQFEILSENEDKYVRRAIAEHPDLPKDLMYKLAEDKTWYVRCLIAERLDLPDDLSIRVRCDSYWSTRERDYKKLENLYNLKSEDLENAYDLIRASKFIDREFFEKTFNYIISNFPDLAVAAKLFKSIILKGKKDLL
jgi:hypothetical protein